MSRVSLARPTMSKPAIEDILAPMPEARPRIYAAHKSLLKVGQTTRDVKLLVSEQGSESKGERP